VEDVKLKPVKSDAGDLLGWSFFCPGCDHPHVYYTSGAMTWAFNGDMAAPSFTPSLLNTCEKHPDPKQRRCHLFVTAGKIIYCNDCSHDMSGQTVDLVDRWPDP
jgi:hypothetical protein